MSDLAWASGAAPGIIMLFSGWLALVSVFSLFPLPLLRGGIYDMLRGLVGPIVNAAAAIERGPYVLL